MKKNILLYSFLLAFSVITAQNNKDTLSHTSGKADFILAFSAYYTYEIPGGDLAQRFGNNHKIGGQFTLKTSSNWIASFDGGYMFGTNLKPEAYSILNPLKTEQGQITSQYGTPSDIVLNERGFSFFVTGGKLFPLKKWVNKNSGFVAMGGFGFLQHKIRIDVNGNDAPQLSEDYKKGYDRLTNGFGFREFIGYRQYADNKMFNFYIGFETTQAYTKNRRTYNYDTQAFDNKERWDILYSFKIGVVIPISKRKPADFYIF